MWRAASQADKSSSARPIRIFFDIAMNPGRWEHGPAGAQNSFDCCLAEGA